MAGELQGKHIAILFTEGVEQVELEKPLDALRTAGADVDLVSQDTGAVQMFQHHDKGDTIEAGKAVAKVEASDYDGLVLPGGVINPDTLRTDADAVDFRARLLCQPQPVGAICHGPWLLVEADVVKDRTVTSWPSLKTDLRNAGRRTGSMRRSSWTRGWSPAATPTICPAFCAKLVEEFAEGKHEGQVAA